PQARHRPQPPDGQGGAHPARPHHPLQAGQGTPEHRRLSRSLSLSTPPLPPPAPDAAPGHPPQRPVSVRWPDQDDAWVTGPLTPADSDLDRGARVGSRPWVHLLLFVLTLLTMTWAGSSFFLNYISAVGTRRVIITPAAA